MKRIFIVGIARSGTTLLQSMIGNHKDIFTFPESHFFTNTMPRQPILRRAHKITDKHKRFIHDFLAQINKTHVYKEYQGKSWNKNLWTRYIISLIDEMANSEAKEIWIEKTPMHLYYIDLITKNCDNCQFIHIVREPLSNIAALYDVSLKYSDSFGQNTLSKALKRYSREISLSGENLKKPNNFLIHYEDLVSDPEKALGNLCNNLQIEFDVSMLSHDSVVEQITQSDEMWKKGNDKELKISNKIKERLSDEQLGWLIKETRKLKSPLLDYYEAN